VFAPIFCTLIFLSFFYYSSRATSALHSFPTRRSSDLSASRPTAVCTADSNVPFPGAMPRSRGIVQSEFVAIHGRSLASRPSCRRSEEHTSELQSRFDLVCRLLLEKKKP